MDVNKMLKKAAGTKTTTSKSKTPMADLSGDENVINAANRFIKAKEKVKDAETEIQLAEQILIPAGIECRRKHIQENGFTNAIKISVDKPKNEEGVREEGKNTITFNVNKRYKEIPTTRQGDLMKIFCDAETAHRKIEDLRMKDDVKKTILKKLDGDGYIDLSEFEEELTSDSFNKLQEIITEYERPYNKYFVTFTAVSLKTAAAEDPKIISTLIETFGFEKFQEIFDVKQQILPHGYTSDQPQLVVDRDANPDIIEKHQRAVDEGILEPFKPSFRT